MKQILILLTTIGFSGLVACTKTSSATSASSASSGLTVVVGSTSLQLGGSTQVTIKGGTGSYLGAQATQGTLTYQSPGAYLFTAPTTATTSQVRITVVDSSNAVASGYLILSGVTSGSTGTTGSTFTSTSCGGTFSIAAGGLNGTLTVTQNASNQISGYLYYSGYNYVYPIWGSCSVTPGAASGTMTFQNVSLGDTYTLSLAISGGAVSLSGQESQGISVTGSAQSLSAAPVAETNQCSGTYTAQIGSNPGTLYLVGNGSGSVAGYLSIPYQGVTNIYSISGTCGASVSLQNKTTGSSYTGTATFSGASVRMTGSFTVPNQGTYTWTAQK